MKKEKNMKLIYVMDPQCGWCYGNSENVSSIRKTFDQTFNFELLVGGMWLGNDAPVGGTELSGFLQAHAPRMAKTTGANVGQAYYDLATDSSYAFSSLEPSAAIVLIKTISPENTFAFTKDVQKMLLQDGKRLDKLENYLPILKSLKINEDDFKKAWLSAENIKNTQAEFSKASQLANGFPTLILQTKDGQKVLASGYFDLEQMVQTLKSL
ncbi:MAG: DsbA family protein [Flavobacteriales bacterium]